MLNALYGLPTTVLILFIVLAALVAFFGLRFLLPAWTLLTRLKTAKATLLSLKREAGERTVDPKRIGEAAMMEKTMAHLWNQFADTLHGQKAVDETGQERVVRWRSTVPAETFFSTQTLVDIPLKADYFKHSPGIMTGLGIIGTFAGLLQGLNKFSSGIAQRPQEPGVTGPSLDPTKAYDALSNLLGGVSEAFIVSAFAILAAMVTTFLEKYLLAQNYKEVEELTHLIDSLYDAGAGEEYLSRLVRASESSATQTAQLKDALVADLREVMADMTRQHIDAIRQSSAVQTETTNKSGQNIAAAIAETLKEPLTRMSDAMSKTSDTNGELVTRALNEALVTFSAKMEDVFGGQMKGMNELLAQTMAAMQTAVGRFDNLAANLDSASRSAADAMAEKVGQALATLEARQQALNAHMGEFVSQIRELIQSSQTETSKELQETLEVLGTRVSEMVGQLDQQAKNASDAHAQKQREFADQATLVVSGLGREVESTVQGLQDRVVQAVAKVEGHARASSEFHKEQHERALQQVDHLLTGLSAQVQALATQATDAVQSMRAAVSSMRDITSDAVNRMNNGADTLFVAASDFAKAGDSVKGVLQHAGTVGDKLTTTAGALSTASASIAAAVNDYQAARDAITRMVSELKLTVGTARREASVTDGLVSNLEAAADTLAKAKGDISEFFEQACTEIANAHKQFASSMESTLRAGNTQFHKELSQSVSLLSSAIKDLGDVVDDIPTS